MAAPAVPAAPEGAAAPAAGSAEDFQAALDRVAQHLGSDDASAVAGATLTLTLMLQSTPLPADLAPAVERLIELAEGSGAAGGELAVRRNAAAALSACLESSDSAVQAAIESRVVRACFLPCRNPAWSLLQVQLLQAQLFGRSDL